MMWKEYGSKEYKAPGSKSERGLCSAAVIFLERETQRGRDSDEDGDERWSSGCDGER